MIDIIYRSRQGEIAVAVDDHPPLGWRFWTLAGFPGDPIEPRPYGGTRCLPLSIVDAAIGTRWLCAMERDGSLRLFGTHDLFPCAEQRGAALFARAMLARHARERPLH